ncbi:hypothetical protein ACJX0J_014342, partial [Zea mays]
DERGCDICGVEITDDAQPVTAHPFRRSTAFLFGNEGTGLSQKDQIMFLLLNLTVTQSGTQTHPSTLTYFLFWYRREALHPPNSLHRFFHMTTCYPISDRPTNQASRGKFPNAMSAKGVHI